MPVGELPGDRPPTDDELHAAARRIEFVSAVGAWASAAAQQMPEVDGLVRPIS